MTKFCKDCENYQDEMEYQTMAPCKVSGVGVEAHQKPCKEFKEKK